MSFNRLEADDFVVSADSITAGIFTDSQIPTITTFLPLQPKEPVIQVIIT